MEQVSDKPSDKVEQLLNNINKEIEIKKISQIFGNFVLEIISDLETGKIGKTEADRIFSYIDEVGLIPVETEGVYLPEEVNGILFEGQLLHDWGTSYGPDLDKMKELARKLL